MLDIEIRFAGANHNLRHGTRRLINARAATLLGKLPELVDRRAVVGLVENGATPPQKHIRSLSRGCNGLCPDPTVDGNQDLLAERPPDPRTFSRGGG